VSRGETGLSCGRQVRLSSLVKKGDPSPTDRQCRYERPSEGTISKKSGEKRKGGDLKRGDIGLENSPFKIRGNGEREEAMGKRKRRVGFKLFCNLHNGPGGDIPKGI